MGVCAIEGALASGPSNRCQSCGSVELFVYWSVTCVPAAAFSVVVSTLNGSLAGVPTVNWPPLDAGATPAGGLDAALGCGVACADAPIFSATTCGGLASPTGTNSVSPATDRNPFIPPGACHIHTCLPDVRSKASTLPLKVAVKTRSPATVAAPNVGASRSAFHWIWPVAASIASNSPVPLLTSAEMRLPPLEVGAGIDNRNVHSAVRERHG